MPPANSEIATKQRETNAADGVDRRGIGEALETVGRRPGFFVVGVRNRFRGSRHRAGGCRLGRSGTVIVCRRAGAFERLRLQDQRYGRVGLQCSQDDAGKQAGKRRGEHGVAKQGHDVSLSSVAGKGHRMTIVVAGIVHDFHVREAEEPHDEEAEQAGEAELKQARTGRGGRCERRGSGIHVLSFHPPPEGTEIMSCRRQVSWLADLALSPPSRVLAQWHLGRATAYSCGGSRGFGSEPAPHSLSVLPEPSTRKL